MSKKSTDSDTHKHTRAHFGGIQHLRDTAVCTRFPPFVLFLLTRRVPGILRVHVLK